MIHWVVFVSGEGTNLQHLLDLESQGKFRYQKIVGVHADRPCRALERAEAAKKSVFLYSPQEKDYEDRVFEFLKKTQANSLFLLGYMRILKAGFLKKWRNPLINLHPSLLPAHKGKDAIEKAFEANDEIFGVSLHDVSEIVDSGKILRQISFPKLPNESLEALKTRVHAFERKIIADYCFDLEIEEERRVALRS